MLPEGRSVAVKRFRVANSDEKEGMIRFIGTARNRAGELFLVSAWADKGSLWDVITRPDSDEPPPDRKYLRWLLETADALAYLHENHIIHGDLRARNILISQEGNALLCDFGLIKHADIFGETRSLGTLGWQSPEIWNGASRSEKTDVYSFGMTIYEVLSGKPPYANLKSSLALINSVLVRDERPPMDPQISSTGVVFEPLWDIAKDCWQASPENRPVMPVVVPVVTVVQEPEMPIDVPSRKRRSNRPRVRFPAGAGDLSGQIRKRSPTPAGANYYSDVYEGELTQTNTRVAIHVLRILDGPNLDDASGDRREQVEKWLTREFASWMALRHPRIVAVLGYALLDDMPCLVYEWCPLVEVLDWLKRNPKADKRRLVFGVADGLQYLHSLQIPVVHGGIKPTNILVDDRGGARISAIGINRWLDDGPGTTTVDRKVFAVRYTAPELLNGTLGEPSAHCDVYSFACVTLAIMTRKPPFFSSRNESDVILAISKSKSPASGDYKELPSRDPLWPILEECWRMEPNQRPSMQNIYVGLIEKGYDNFEADLYLIFIVEVTPGGDIRSVTLLSLAARYSTGSGDILKGTADTGIAVAVKRLRITAGGYTTDQAEQIQSEANLWQRLDHPNVLQFLGTAPFEGNLCLISPWMDNGSLKDYLPNHPDADRPKFLLETADALVYLHGKLIIHGDVQATNILVSNDNPPHALMCDFGRSRPTGIPTAPGLKGAGMVKWQAPELWDNQPKSFKSDVFSFGITIYEILSGKDPYPNYAAAALLVQVATKDKRPTKEPLTCPRTGEDWQYLWNIAEKCWKTELTERPGMVSVRRWLEIKRMDGKEVDVAEPTASTSVVSEPSGLEPPPSIPMNFHTVPTENPVAASPVHGSVLPGTPEAGTLPLVAPDSRTSRQ
ncbi:hypothetical protein FRB99_004268 [Tulasnella sp. 403]|nr:hypothetical protein FRB99_004268 [Tulasnella sp. 403]